MKGQAEIEQPVQLMVEGNDQKNFLVHSLTILEFRAYKYGVLVASTN